MDPNFEGENADNSGDIVLGLDYSGADDATPLPEETHERSGMGESDIGEEHTNSLQPYLNYLSTLEDCNSNLSLQQIQVSFLKLNLISYFTEFLGGFWIPKY